MKWIYLSPHLDDVVYSCGGLIWEQIQSGVQVEIWTICAGNAGRPLSSYAQSLHERWQTGLEAVAVRRAEDLEACRRMGALAKHFDVPDCIYRRLPESGEPVVMTDEDLFSPLKPGEIYLVEKLTDELAKALPLQANVVCPLTVGGHMDHHLTRTAAEALKRPLWYYPDFPYAAREEENLSSFVDTNWRASQFLITESALHAWQKGVSAYATQISTFWGGVEEMKSAIRSYWQDQKSSQLWQQPQVVKVV